MKEKTRDDKVRNVEEKKRALLEGLVNSVNMEAHKLDGMSMSNVRTVNQTISALNKIYKVRVNKGEILKIIVKHKAYAILPPFPEFLQKDLAHAIAEKVESWIR